MTDPIERGQAVADFLNREPVQDALAEIEGQIMQEWKSGATVEAREVAAANYRAFVNLRSILQSYVEEGQRAQTDLLRRQRREKEI